jgi:hypothetical protein
LKEQHEKSYFALRTSTCKDLFVEFLLYPYTAKRHDVLKRHVRWTEEEVKIHIRKEEIVGKFNVPFISRETNMRDFKRRQEPAKRNFQFLESSKLCSLLSEFVRTLPDTL